MSLSSCDDVGSHCWQGVVNRYLNCLPRMRVPRDSSSDEKSLASVDGNRDCRSSAENASNDAANDAPIPRCVRRDMIARVRQCTQTTSVSSKLDVTCTTTESDSHWTLMEQKEVNVLSAAGYALIRSVCLCVILCSFRIVHM